MDVDLYADYQGSSVNPETVQALIAAVDEIGDDLGIEVVEQADAAASRRIEVRRVSDTSNVASSDTVDEVSSADAASAVTSSSVLSASVVTVADNFSSDPVQSVDSAPTATVSAVAETVTSLSNEAETTDIPLTVGAAEEQSKEATASAVLASAENAVTSGATADNTDAVDTVRDAGATSSSTSLQDCTYTVSPAEPLQEKDYSYLLEIGKTADDTPTGHFIITPAIDGTTWKYSGTIGMQINGEAVDFYNDPELQDPQGKRITHHAEYDKVEFWFDADFQEDTGILIEHSDDTVVGFWYPGPWTIKVDCTEDPDPPSTWECSERKPLYAGQQYETPASGVGPDFVQTWGLVNNTSCPMNNFTIGNPEIFLWTGTTYVPYNASISGTYTPFSLLPNGGTGQVTANFHFELPAEGIYRIFFDIITESGDVLPYLPDSTAPGYGRLYTDVGRSIGGCFAPAPAINSVDHVDLGDGNIAVSVEAENVSDAPTLTTNDNESKLESGSNGNYNGGNEADKADSTNKVEVVGECDQDAFLEYFYHTTRSDLLGSHCKTNSCGGWVGFIGDPVNTAIGNFIQQETDAAVAGPGDSTIRLQRTYNSQAPILQCLPKRSERMVR
ncbi:MAG: hypothetical protein D3909_11630 [Candidatus Electrothrix sp. ATG1]|nr:hypothetical protein [Candidatus Electrothrix sp. ATG1]